MNGSTIRNPKGWLIRPEGNFNINRRTSIGRLETIVMQFGTLIHDEYKAYWGQIWKIRIGMFVCPLKAMWGFDFKQQHDFGWALCVGPFQVCYYKFA